MPIAVSPEFQATVQGQSMAVSARLTLTLPAGPYSDVTVALVSVSGLGTSMQTDVPEGVRTQAGFYTIGGSFTLAGRLDASMTIAELLDPDNAASPMYRQSAKGAPVLFEIGLRPPGHAIQWVTKLTGRVSSYVYDVDDASVTLACVDLSADWSALPTLYPGLTAPLNAGMTSEYVMDAIARNASAGAVSSWPAQRPSCVLAIGFRSSLVAEFGAGGAGISGMGSTDGVPTWAAGPWGTGFTGLDNGDEPVWGFASVPGVTSVSGLGTDSYVEVLVSGLSAGLANSVHWHIGDHSTEEFRVTINPGSQVITYTRGAVTGTYTFNVAIDSAAHRVGVELHMAIASASWSAKLHVDGAVYSSGAQTASGIRLAGHGTLQLGVDRVVIAGLQVTGETSPTVTAFTPLAVLDPSLNPMQITPAVDPNGSTVAELQTIAAAELGYIRRDESGVLRFTNRNNLADQALGRDISSRTSLKAGLQAAVGAFVEYQRVQVDYSGWKFGKYQSIFTLDSVWRIDGHSTQTFTLALSDVVVNFHSPATLLPDGDDPLDGGTYYRASYDAAGLNGILTNSPLTITLARVGPNILTVTIVNTGPTVWMITSADYLDIDAGTPSLWIGGKLATPRTVILDLGDQTQTPLQITGNQYRQDRDAATALGEYVLNDLHAARVDYTGISIVPDPSIQTGDLVTLKDPDVSGLDTPALIWGWTFDATFGDSPTWDMTVSARALGPPGAWLLGYVGHSELGDGVSIPGTAYLY